MANQREKDEFFRHLDSLEDDSTASEDDGVFTRPAKIRKVVPALSASKLDTHARQITDRTMAVKPKPELRKKTPSIARAQTDTQNLQTHVTKLPQVSRSVRRTNSEPSHVATTSSLAKAKQTLFGGCRFYFIPNNDDAKIKRLRIQSAVSQGALWIRRLDEGITHVIVDANLTADAVIRLLSGKTDLKTVPVVKDKWLIESISHRILKDVRSNRFLLEGIPPLTNDLLPDTTSASLAIASEITEAQPAGSMLTPLVPTGTPSDELTEIMQELQHAETLPLDAEVDLDRFVSLSSGDEADNQSAAPSTRISRPDANRGFACMEPHTGKSDGNPNNRIIEILQMMATYYDRTGDHWRTTAYRKAITALRKQKRLISTKKEALQVYGIGTRLADKIEEIVTTDRLQKLDCTLNDSSDRVLQLFMGVYGAGLKQSRLWMDQGYRTLDDLKNTALTDNQKVGIEHYDDFQQKIPRAEVAQHGAIVQKALHRADNLLTAIIGGSYRRGMPDSGDIDIMITHDAAELPELRKWVFGDVVPYLFSIGFLKYAFATSRSHGKQAQTTPIKTRASKSNEQNPGADAFADFRDTGTKFHGASVLPTTDNNGQALPWRRIDFLLVPASALGASLLYFTGNDIFNRSMRLLASRKGMWLNQYGLYKNVLKGKGRIKETEGELLEGRSERRIFQILGVPWREPEERRC